MKDRFKFRCFNPEDKTMHYTDFVVTATGFISRLEAMNNSNRIFYIDNENLDMDKKLLLMQCTGSKDKNGKLIYEGDIVETWKFSTGQIKKAIVKWNEPRCGFRLFNTASIGASPQSMVNVTTIEIIGNIYENKEILDEENND